MIAGGPRSDSQPYIDELYNVSHREFSTGFFFDDPHELVPTRTSYQQRYRYMARVVRAIGPGRFELDVKNGFSRSDAIEFVGPDQPRAPDTAFRLFDPEGQPVDQLTHQEGGSIEPGVAVEPGYLLRCATDTPDD